MKKKKEKTKKKKQSFFKENYSKSWDYLKDSRDFIYAVILIFFVFVLIGYFLPTPGTFLEMISKFVEELLAKTEGMSQFDLVKFIFLNNLQSSFSGLIFGFLLGILPVIAAIANGYVVGVVSRIVVSEEGLGSLWMLAPHGIFELPAIFISLGLGVKFGSFLFQEKKADSFKNFFWNSIRVFLLIVLPLLIIAAIIEGSLIFLFPGS